jgi:membrane protease YdiL (CAAX protease family)
MTGVGFCWLVLAPFAFALARSRHLSPFVAVPIALAFLTEVAFYILPGFPGAIELLRRITRRQAAGLITAAALLPYVILTIPEFSFSPERFLTLAAMMAAVAFWFLLPAHPVRDLSFLVLLGGILLSGISEWIYRSPDPKTPVFVLGHLTLISTAVLAVLLFDQRHEIRFGFIPTARESGIGILWALGAAAVALPLGLKLGVLHLGAHPVPLWAALGEVLAFFWVIALSEEFFFRALLQQWLTDWTGSAGTAIIFAAAAFGACHLSFGKQFPNFRFAILAGVVGLFYGGAYRQARSMRASMVTHALLVSGWRLFLHS